MRRVFLASILLAGLFSRPALAATVALGASKDSSLYEDKLGATANGAGQFIFSGSTATGFKRRALLAFDFGGIPAGSTITFVTLGLSQNMQISGDRELSLYRVSDSWGEGTSDPTGQEGQGAAATTGDATWLHRFYDTTSWTSSGGDYDPTPSATTVVGDAFIQWSWSSSEMISDVQGWLDAPATNEGWILIGNEIDIATAKRFGSRTNPTAGERPVLTVQFTPPPGAGAGATAESGAGALRIARAAGSNLTITWGGSSCAADPDFELYEGVLGSPASLFPVTCSTSGATSLTITPGSGNRFYVAVPRGALLEGSYGMKTGAVQRPPSASACLPQSILSCP